MTIMDGRKKIAGSAQHLRCNQTLIAVAIALLLLSVGADVGRAQDSTRAPAVRVSGVVFDSVSKRPLEGAVVQLVATLDPARGRTVLSGANGAYSFEAIPTGTYLVGFYHAVLDSLGIEPPLLRVEARSEGDVRAPLAVPSAGTLLARLCGATAARDSTGVFLGYVRSALGRSAGRTAEVRVQWSEISVGAKGIVRSTPAIHVETSDVGGFAICGIPTGGSVLARAWTGTDSSGFVDLEVPPNGLLRRDLFIGQSTLFAVQPDSNAAAPDSAGPMTTVLRGRGALRGTVRRSGGDPIDGARLVFWGSGAQVASGADGAYTMQQLPAGTYTLEARALGFLPHRRAVDIMDGDEVVADVVLESFRTMLDTIRVTTTRLYTSPQQAEFERRKRFGFGYFMDEDAIEKRNPMFMADLFRMTPGITITRGQSFGDQVLMRGRGFSGGYCAPAVFVDGIRAYGSDGNIDQIVNPQEVRALEVYTRASSMPAQFQTMEGCGSIVVWTGGRRRK